MVLHKKATSKRSTTRQRAKIDKKVREHRRKEKKGAGDDHPNKKAKKDPGIPSMWPMKEAFIRKMGEEKEKEHRQREAGSKPTVSIMQAAKSDNNALHRLLDAATARSAAHSGTRVDEDEGVSAPSLVGGVNKAFYREIQHVVQAADVILEVLDARDPLGCRAREVEETILKQDPNKRIVLVLNKIDLVPSHIAEAWIKHLRREFPTVAFRASTQSQRSHIGRIRTPALGAHSESALASSECLGADELVQLLKNYCRNLSIKTAITVGVIGFPNVGKSSLINSLKRAKVCKVGATPGVTTSRQEIQLDRNIKLLDCPGVVFASKDGGSSSVGVLLRNCLKIEQLEDPISPVESILALCSAEQLMMLYGISRFTDVNDFLAKIAFRQGKLKKGGVPRLEAAARIVLNDWNQGKIAYFTTPPPALDDPQEVGAIVSQWAPEFNVNDTDIRME